MQEWRGKYADAEVVRTAPMIDGPVLFALGRTLTELFLPAPVAAMCLWRFGFWGLLLPALLFFAMPIARRRWGRNRLLHWLWGMGHARGLRCLEVARGGAKTGLDTPFRHTRLARYRP